MRRKQLQQLVDDFRHEAGLSTRANVGVDHVDTIKQLLRRTQELLYDEYDWPHLNRRFPTITLNAGQVLYDLPEELDYTRVTKVVQWVDGTPHPLCRGIDLEDYETVDRYDSIEKYDFTDTTGIEQVEVWPTPARNDTSIQMSGVRKLREMTADSDTCDLDAIAIVLFAAADYLESVKANNAKTKLAAAQSRMTRLRARAVENRDAVNLSRDNHRSRHEGVTLRVTT